MTKILKIQNPQKNMIPEEKKETTDSTKPKTEQRPNVNQTFNFYAPIGQQIAHVDKIEAHFDKDMTMHVDDSDGALSVDNGKGNADFSDNGKSEATETMAQKSKPDCTADDMFRFIHPSLDAEETQAVHREVVNLCKRFGIQEICAHLYILASDRKILLPMSPKSAFEELRRIGMPTDRSGYEYKTFTKYYKRCEGVKV